MSPTALPGWGEAFIAAVAAQSAVRLWLASRQIATVRANRDRIPKRFSNAIAPDDQRRAADYTVARAKFSRTRTVFDAAVSLTLTVGGGLAAIQAAVGALGWSEPWQGMLLVLCVILLLQVLSLPFALWRIFRIEARFGFNRTTPGLFALDLIRQLVLGAALGGPVLLATLALMMSVGRSWWLWVWLLWQAATLALTWAAPRFIAPLFNRFSPLADADLEKRIAALLARCGYAAQGGVYVMDGSRRSAHGNAYFTGLGRNKRIVFFDTLIAQVDAEEIEAVLAHELGHFKLRHVLQRLILSMGVSFVGLALLAAVAREPTFYAAFGIAAPSPAITLLLFAFIVPVVSFFATPIGAWWSRRQEYAADAFAASHADPRKLIGALVKLYRDNASTLTPDPLHSAFYDSHPSATQRIARLESLGRTSDWRRSASPTPR
jgi:STE24 endopeptidase